MSYLLHVGVLVALYGVLATSLNLLAGYTGLLSLCAAGFFGVGAYAEALLTADLGWPWALAMAAALGLTAFLAVGIGAASVRFRDDYFAIATFAFQVILTTLMVNWVEVTRGPMGIPGIPPPSLFGWQVESRVDYLIVSLALAVATFLLLRRLVASPYGRLLRAVREDEVLVESLGRNVVYLKVSAFVVGAVLSALAGSIYAPYISYIDPGSFTIYESIFILAIVIIGGAGSLWGSLVGAVFLVAMPEALRFLGLPSNLASGARQILYGALLAACMAWRPQGFIGRFGFQERSRR